MGPAHLSKVDVVQGLGFEEVELEDLGGRRGGVELEAVQQVQPVLVRHHAVHVVEQKPRGWDRGGGGGNKKTRGGKKSAAGGTQPWFPFDTSTTGSSSFVTSIFSRLVFLFVHPCYSPIVLPLFKMVPGVC